MEDLPVSETVLNSGDIVLQPENMVTGQLQWNSMAEVKGVTANEYLVIVVNGGGNTIIYGGSPEIVDNGLGNSFTQK